MKACVIFEKIKDLLIIYWKSRPFRGFMSLYFIVLVGYSAFSITYDFSSEKHILGISLSKGEYNWILVVILAIITIAFCWWMYVNRPQRQVLAPEKTPLGVDIRIFLSRRGYGVDTQI